MNTGINSIGLFLYIICLLFFPWKSSAQYHELTHKTHAQRSPLLFEIFVNQLRENQLDSVTVFRKISEIENTARKAGDEDLLLETEMMRIHYRFYRSYYSKDGVLKSLDSLRQVARKTNRNWLLARVESLAALTCFGNDYNYELGFFHFKQMDEVVGKLSINDFPEKQNCYYQMGYAYYQFSEWENSIRYFTNGLKETPAFPSLRFNIQIHNNLGLCYQKLGKFDSSDYHFGKALEWAKKEPPMYRIWDGIISGNLGYNQYLQNHYSTARPLLAKDVSIAEETGDWGLAVGSLVPLAEIALQDGLIAEARRLTEKARDYTIRSHQYPRWEKLYPLISKLEALAGNGTDAARFLDSAIFVKDSMARKYNAMQMARAEQKIALEKQDAAFSLLASEKNSKRWERNFLLLSLGILLAVSAWFFVVLRRKANQKQKDLLIAQKELEEAERQLDLFTRNIFEKNLLIESLSQKTNGEHIEEIEQLRRSTILTEDDWKIFRELFDKVHAGFLIRLQEIAPQLTPSEIRFVALTKLGIEPKKMAAMLGVGPEAIRQYRSRLRKKLQLTEETSIENWLHQL